MVVTLEALDANEAGLLLFNVASPGDDNGSVPELGHDPDEFKRVVAEHNWRDPVSMWSLVESMTWISKKYWDAVGPRDRSGIVVNAQESRHTDSG